MSKRSTEDLIELARPMLKLHGTLSTAYLMRKFKVDYDEAQKIMQGLELPIWITEQEYNEQRTI